MHSRYLNRWKLHPRRWVLVVNFCTSDIELGNQFPVKAESFSDGLSIIVQLSVPVGVCCYYDDLCSLLGGRLSYIFINEYFLTQGFPIQKLPSLCDPLTPEWLPGYAVHLQKSLLVELSCESASLYIDKLLRPACYQCEGLGEIRVGCYLRYPGVYFTVGIRNRGGDENCTDLYTDYQSHSMRLSAI